MVAIARAGVIGYAAQPHYSAASDVSYSSVSVPVAGPIYSKVAAPAYAKIVSPVSYAVPALKAVAPVAYAAPYAKTVVAEEFAPAHYQFSYGVSDPHTGDSKSQEEYREGDVVKGSYSLIEADGSKRIVEYTSDPHNGFNAVVHKEASKVIVKAPLVAKIAAPVAYPSPTYASYSAPVVAKVAYSPASAVSYSSLAAPAVYSAPSSYYH